MSSKGWFNLESQSSIASASNLIPDNQFFEGDSAFSFLKLSKTTRLYGFFGWYVAAVSFIIYVLKTSVRSVMFGTAALSLGLYSAFSERFCYSWVLSLVSLVSAEL